MGSVPVERIYYLEKGVMDSEYYVLGYSAPGMHATLQLYRGEKPTFFQVHIYILLRIVCIMCVSVYACVLINASQKP